MLTREIDSLLSVLDSYEADQPGMIVNFRIQSAAFFPFCGLLIAFIFVFCTRKIEDYFLRISIFFLVTSMTLRICMCLVLVICMMNAKHDDGSVLLEMKIQVI